MRVVLVRIDKATKEDNNLISKFKPKLEGNKAILQVAWYELSVCIVVWKEVSM